MKKAIKKILNVILHNYYFILGSITLLASIFEDKPYTGIVSCVVGVGCLILQELKENKRKLSEIELKLLDMSAFHDECELLNIQVLSGLQKIILANKKVEEDQHE